MTWGGGVRLSRVVRMWVPLGAALALIAMLTGAALPGGGPGQSAPRRAALAFIANQGQLDRRVAFYLPGRAGSVYFTARGATMTLPAAPGAPTYATRLAFVGGRPVTPVGTSPLQTTVSYFHAADWRTGIPTFGGVVYDNVWPGIDVAFSGSGSSLEYRFLVEPGADPSDIRLAYRGASSLAVGGDGSLQIGTPAGQTVDGAPRTFQRVNGRTVPVRSGFRVLSRTGFAFSVGPFDSAHTLVIDPITFSYSGYLGGSGNDAAYGVATDGSGNVFVTGATTSTDFPVKVGPQPAANGNDDAFVVKLDPSGALVYAGFLGGSGQDFGYSIAADAAGNAYVTGGTTSSNFPVVTGPGTAHGAEDAFVTKISPDGSTLLYSGLLGGPNADVGFGIALDSAGDAYVVGALSNNCSAAALARPVAPATTGGNDVLLAKVSPTGALVGTLRCYGGAQDDSAYGAAVDSSGHLFVTGFTASSDFPVFAPLDVSYNGGPEDGFVSEVSADLTGLVYSGYLGSPGDDYGAAVAVNGSGNAFVTGQTDSPLFPHVGAPELTFGGASDAFVTGLSSTGTTSFSGFLGGGFPDAGFGISMAPSGDLVVTGQADSPDFPRSGPSPCWSTSFDAFVSTLASDGSKIKTSVLFGGSGDDAGVSVAAIGNGAAVVGFTNSKNFFPVSSGSDKTFNGGPNDAWVTKWNFGQPGPISPPGVIVYDFQQGNKPLKVKVITVDGCRYTLIPHGLNFSAAPVWSPDGTFIAATASSGGNPDIYLLNFFDPSGKPKRLTHDAASEKQPAWSPNGKQIVFASDRGNPVGQYDIWVMNSNGSHAHPLIGGPLSQQNPAWSPNGKTIVFQAFDTHTGLSRLYAATSTGHNVHPLTSGPQDSSPNWSPDGTQIAFQRSNQIYLMHADGSSIHKLSHQPAGANKSPAWSPEGERIAFDHSPSATSSQDDIYLINANGTNLIKVTNDKSKETFPRWLPVIGASGSGSAASSHPSRPLLPPPRGGTGLIPGPPAALVRRAGS